MIDFKPESECDSALLIRKATSADLVHVTALDARITGQAKPDYWQDIFERYGARKTNERFFLIAKSSDDNAECPVLGLIAGEVRGWEFGSDPCGWIFAVSVDPDTRERGIGERLFKAITTEFRAAGINKIRTMVQRSNPLHMSFFRSEGMTAGPYTQLELNLDEL